ncbi:MAG: N-acetyltransferase [Bacteroidetes bacterium]|nr:N-acetyltransferase [Bacteroidota bacterium]
MNGESELINNEDASQFELFQGESVCFLEYLKIDDTYYLNHTKVPAGLQGEGLGSELMCNVLQYIEGQGAKFFPSCTFAKAFIKRHPEWKKIMK